MKMLDLVEQWRVMRARQTKPVTDRNRVQIFSRHLYPKIEEMEAEAVAPKDALERVHCLSFCCKLSA